MRLIFIFSFILCTMGCRANIVAGHRISDKKNQDSGDSPLEKDQSPIGSEVGSTENTNNESDDLPDVVGKNSETALQVPPTPSSIELSLSSTPEAEPIIESFDLQGQCEDGRTLTVTGDINAAPVLAICSGNLFNIQVSLSGDDGKKQVQLSDGVTGLTIKLTKKFCSGANIVDDKFPSPGDGSSTNPFRVCTYKQLYLIRGANLSKNYLLMSHIDASPSFATAYEPIGFDYDSNGITLEEKFSGVFDGDGHKIFNLIIERASATYVGMFGYAENAVIKNLGIEGGNVKGVEVGGFVGHGESVTLKNIYFFGSVTGSTASGGLAGYLGSNSLIEDYYVKGNIFGGTGAGGGIVGTNQGSAIRNGFVAADASGTIKGCFLGNLAAGTGESALLENSYCINTVAGPKVGTNTSAGTGISTINNIFFDSNISRQPVVNCGSETGAGATGCTGISSEKLTSKFFDQFHAVYSGWNFGSSGAWIFPDNGVYPDLRFRVTNAPVSFNIEFRENRKIGYSDASSYRLAGHCSEPGATIELSVLDSVATTSTPCIGGLWQTVMNLSSLPEGPISVLIKQNGVEISQPVSLPLVKETGFCNTNPGTNADGFATGDGSVGNPYTICTPTHLNNVRNYPTAQFSLRNNIDLNVAPFNSDPGFTPIGDVTCTFIGIWVWITSNTFSGGFEGNYHQINNLYINRDAFSDANCNWVDGPQEDWIGLFRKLEASAIVRNLALENVNVQKAANNTGALVGESFANLDNIVVTGDVRGDDDAAGMIAGIVNGDISNSFARGSITVKDTGAGIAGIAQNIINCGALVSVAGYGASGVAVGATSIHRSFAGGYAKSNGSASGLGGGIISESVSFNDVHAGSNAGALSGGPAGQATDSYSVSRVYGGAFMGDAMGKSIERVLFSGIKVNNSGWIYAVRNDAADTYANSFYHAQIANGNVELASFNNSGVPANLNGFDPISSAQLGNAEFLSTANWDLSTTGPWSVEAETYACPFLKWQKLAPITLNACLKQHWQLDP